MEVHNIVQEPVTKTIPKKKKCKNAKWLSEEASQIAKERRQAKGKGERERYTQLNAEFPQNNKERKVFFLKVFLNEPCKEREEKNRMGKTRDLFQENWSYQGNISCKDRHDKGQKTQGPNRSRRD